MKDYQSLFRRFSIDVGSTAPDLLAKTTLTARLESYAQSTLADPSLEALFCQFGRYLLISCSRDPCPPISKGCGTTATSPRVGGRLPLEH